MRKLRHSVAQYGSWPYRTITLFIAPILALAVLLPNAWISDDAYISLRAAKNLLLGYGPTFNISERVQVFTHPLWMVPLTLSQALFPHHTAIAVMGFGIAFTLAAMIIFLRDIKPIWLIALTTLLMLSSKAFIDFSTSGLENPLLYVLIVLFAHEYLGKQRVFRLALLASLAATTRADAALLFVPAFFPLIWGHWRERAFWVDLAKGMLPLIIWELFSATYFGYLLPNTVYAKVNTGFPHSVLYLHGWYYLQNSFDIDKVTLPIIVLGMLAGLVERNMRKLLLSAGIILYFIALFGAGGDYMSGRFLAVPFVLSLYLVVSWFQAWPKHQRRLLMPLAAILALVAVFTPASPIVHPLASTVNLSRDHIQDKHRIADEGRFWCPWNCLYDLKNQSSNPYYQVGAEAQSQSFTVFPSIGLVGYMANPKTFIVDPLALADPLLSHLPAIPGSRIGHFERTIPQGYLATLQTGRNVIADPCIRRLYDDIHPVVTGPLFTVQRFKKIVKVNLGISDREYAQCEQAAARKSVPHAKPSA